MQELNERDWRRLAKTIHQGNCILLMGPDAAVDPESIPLTTRLAEFLAKKIEPAIDISDPHGLSHVAQLYQNSLDRVELELAVEDFYRMHEGKTTALHEELASLPFNLCINTTADGFLYNAFKKAKKDPLSDFYHFRRTQPSKLNETEARPVVYDLYGNCQAADSLILTENDLLEFLVNVAKHTPALPPFITSRFTDSETTFLFVGFGFSQWYLRVLLYVLRAHHRRNRSLALEESAFFSQPDLPQTILFFSREHHIEFRKLSWQAFAQELRHHHAALSGGIGQSTNPLNPDAPTVFLCHAHEDAEKVAELGQRFQRAGIRTWMDRQDLRGGDNWERLIPQVIDKQVDYVVVLQTPQMMEKVESYCYKEIEEALDRQRGFAEGFRFLFPLLLGLSKGLDKLSRIHNIDMRSEEAFEALVKDIESDWKKRPKTQ